MKTKVLLKKGEGRTINAGGLWIYDNEIKEIHGHFKNGDIVDVYAHNEYPLGRGYINQNSKIRIRLMTRNINQEIDSDFLRMRLQNAWIIVRRQWILLVVVLCLEMLISYQV